MWRVIVVLLVGGIGSVCIVSIGLTSEQPLRSGSWVALVVTDKSSAEWDPWFAGTDVVPSYSTTYPQDLSAYAVVVVDRYASSNQTTAALLESYVASGGGVVITEGNPLYMGMTQEFTSWFGASTYANGGGVSLIVRDQPFCTNLSVGDTLYDLTGHGTSFGGVGGLGPNAREVAEWSNSPGEISAFSNTYGDGKVFFNAVMSSVWLSSQDDNMTLFVAVLHWMTGRAFSGSWAALVVTDKSPAEWDPWFAGTDVVPSYATTYPQDLSAYAVVVVDRYASSNQTTAALLESYVWSGGGVVIAEGNPLYMGMTQEFTSWFGASTYVNGGGVSLITRDQPFCTNLSAGDTLYDLTGHGTSFGGVGGLGPNATEVAEWGNSPGEISAFSNTYGDGKVFFNAVMSSVWLSSQDDNMTLFVAVLHWMTGRAFSGYVRSGAGIGISAVVMSGLPGDPSTNSSGYYSAIVNDGWSGTVTPSHACYSFSPSSWTYSNVSSDLSNQNFTGIGKTYEVSGFVRNESTAGIAGVTLSGLPSNPVTNASGHYSATVDCGWSGAAAPTKDCYSFSPAIREYEDVESDQGSSDYTASKFTHTISGAVRNRSGTGVSGVSMGGFPSPVTTNSNGFYQGTVECGWSGTVTPSIESGVFDPPQRVYTNVQASVANADHTVNRPPQMTSYAPATIAEGDSYDITIQATDPDADAQSLTASGMPVNAAFVDNGDGLGGFSFNPDYAQSGDYAITFTASDGQFSTQTGLEITVTNTNRPPSAFALALPVADAVLRSTSVDFAWASTTDPDINEDVGYWVFVEESLTAELPDSTGTDGNTTLTLSDLDEETAYRWRVVARDTSGGATENTGGWWQFAIDDLTPPELIFGLIPSPVLPFSADFVVKPSEVLERYATAYVELGGDSDSFDLDHRIVSSDGDLFSARYAFSVDGAGTIILHGVDLSTNETVDTIPFSGYRIAADAPVIAVSHDRMLSVRQERGSGVQAALIVCYQPSNLAPFERTGWTLLGSPSLFATAAPDGPEPVEVRFRPDQHMPFGDLTNVIIFQHSDGQWEPLQTWRSTYGSDFIAYPEEMGVFLAAAGPGDGVLQASPMPRFHQLHQNVPNPFNAGTTIRVEIGEGIAGSRPDARLELFNILGQKVRTLLDGPMIPSLHALSWDGTNDAGQSLPSGVYFARLAVGEQTTTIKMVLVK